MVARLCTPIEGTDAGRLADCLGLDPSRFAGANAGGGGGEDAREDALVSGAAFFDDPARFKVTIACCKPGKFVMNCSSVPCCASEQNTR